MITSLRLHSILFAALLVFNTTYGISTKEVVVLVNDAGALLEQKGIGAFADLKKENSRWRSGETYVFILDSAGNMLLHADPELEGKNQRMLKDLNGRPVIQGIMESAYGSPDYGGWYHYQWPVPGGLLPRWKSTYAKVFRSAEGKTLIVGCGVYDDRMEKEFVLDMVNQAVRLLETAGREGFPLLRDVTGPYIAKDAYIFVVDTNGVELVNPGFPSLEGRNVMDVKDVNGKSLMKEMFGVVKDKGAGWVDYYWPKPGQSVSTLKSAYVRKANMGDEWVIVGCGIYLSDAPVMRPIVPRPTNEELIVLVREAARLLEKSGVAAYPEFRKMDTKWFHDDTYFFVWSLDGIRVFNAANPAGEGKKVDDSKDVLGRPWGKMFLEAANSPSGEGWVHYLHPEPGDLFPTWKSSFIKRVKFPDGNDYLVGCGIYNMTLDKTFIEDVVNRAVTAIEQQGIAAFTSLRDKSGPFRFMETYVFVDRPDGTELVNPAQPSLEGKNLIDHLDAKGKPLVREYIGAALKNGSAWVDYQWYRPGSNEPAPKHTFVHKAQYGGQVYIVGAGYYDAR
ncbi:MAG: hypothetical protein RL021_1097 [Bacteroidota bacterium]